MTSSQVNQSSSGNNLTERSCLLAESETTCSLDAQKRKREDLALFVFVALGVAGLLFFFCTTGASHPGLDNVNVGYSYSPYTHFQGLGFQIYTGGAPAYLNDGRKNPECIGQYSYGHLVGELQCYVGQHDQTYDLKQRLKIMSAAVDRAYDLSDKNRSTLKVFLAPEFFWRGKKGAYEVEPNLQECGYVCQILHGLENIVEQPRFKDWLFVFGTVVASERINDGDDEHADYLFYNFAPVYKGFDPSETSHVGKRFIVPKRYVSNLDFLTPRRNFNHSMAKELIDQGKDVPSSKYTIFNPYNFDRRKYDNEGWEAYQQDLAELGYSMIYYGWFVMDNITFTIEICLDHARHVALDSFMANLVTGSKAMIPNGGSDNLTTFTTIPTHQAQISLVSSAGMIVHENALALANGGSIFLQDGLSNNISIWEDQGEKGILFDGGTEQVRRDAVLSPTDVFFEYTLNNKFKKHRIHNNDEELREAFNRTFSTKVYKPHLVVYKPVYIPNV